MQVLGVFAREWVEPLARTLAGLGSHRALVVHGEDGLDELSLSGVTQVAELRDQKVHSYRIAPQELGLHICHLDALRGGDAQTNAGIIRAILSGEASLAQAEIALLNAAAAIYVAGRAEDLPAALKLGREAVDSGAARRVLERLIAVTNRAGRRACGQPSVTVHRS